QDDARASVRGHRWARRPAESQVRSAQLIGLWGEEWWAGAGLNRRYQDFQDSPHRLVRVAIHPHPWQFGPFAPTRAASPPLATDRSQRFGASTGRVTATPDQASYGHVPRI